MTVGQLIRMLRAYPVDVIVSTEEDLSAERPNVCNGSVKYDRKRGMLYIHLTPILGAPQPKPTSRVIPIKG